MAALLTVIMLMAAALTGSSLEGTVPTPAPDGSPTGAVMVSVAEVTQGEAVAITVQIQPGAVTKLEIQSITFADPQTWKIENIHPDLPLTTGTPVTFLITAKSLRAVESQPVLQVSYTGDGLAGSLALAGNAVKVQNPSLWAKVTRSWNTDVMTGALVSIVTTLAVTWFTKRLEKREQKRRNRERVISLLNMLCFQGEGAARQGTSMDTQPFQVLYEEGDLYATMKRLQLDMRAQALWTAAMNHNGCLNSGESLHSASELTTSTRHLKESLMVLESNPKRKLFSKRTR